MDGVEVMFKIILVSLLAAVSLALICDLGKCDYAKLNKIFSLGTDTVTGDFGYCVFSRFNECGI